MTHNYDPEFSARMALEFLDYDWLTWADREQRREALCCFCQLSPAEPTLTEWEVGIDPVDGSDVDYFWCRDCWDRELALGLA